MPLGTAIRAVPFSFSLADFPFRDAGQFFPSPGSASPVRLSSASLPLPWRVFLLTAIFFAASATAKGTRPPGP